MKRHRFSRLRTDWPVTEAWQEAIEDNLNERYIPVSMVAENIFFAVPCAEARDLAVSNDIAKIKRQLVAVKVPAREDEDLGEEVTCLMWMREHSIKANKTPRMTQIVEVGNTDPYLCKWFSMTAVTSCLDLYKLKNSIEKPLHRGFIVHFFVQAMEALDYLHAQNFVHRDMYYTQLLIDTTQQDVPGLPNIVLADFGEARNFNHTHTPVDAEQKEILQEVDRWLLCTLAHGILLTHGRSCKQCINQVFHDNPSDGRSWKEFDEFAEFLRTIDPKTDRSVPEDQAPTWQEAQRRFRTLIRESRTPQGLHMSEKDVMDLQETLEEISKAGRYRLEADIEALLPKLLGP